MKGTVDEYEELSLFLHLADKRYFLVFRSLRALLRT